jgi:rubrerythrin
LFWFGFLFWFVLKRSTKKALRDLAESEAQRKRDEAARAAADREREAAERARRDAERNAQDLDAAAKARWAALEKERDEANRRLKVRREKRTICFWFCDVCVFVV